MRLNVGRNELLKSLVAIGRVVEKKNSIPILGNVVLDATADDVLGLTGTDLDLTIADLIPASVETKGVTTVPTHLLADIVKKSPLGSTISLSLSDDRGVLIVETGRSKFRLQCLPVEDFPQFFEKPSSHSFELPGRTFRRLFERTAFAMSSEETRYYLNGVFLHAHAEEACLRGVATDGHRLARTQIPMPVGANGMSGMIVPKKSVVEFMRLTDTDADVGVDVSDACIRITLGSLALTSKLIDGTFPDYARVIPARESNPITVTMKSSAMQTAVERVMAVAAAKGRGMTIALHNGVAMLSMKSADTGEATDEVDVGMEDGETGSVGFNANYLRDLLGHQTGDDMIMRLGKSGSPVLIEDSKDELSLYVLMPMNVT